MTEAAQLVPGADQQVSGGRSIKRLHHCLLGFRGTGNTVNLTERRTTSIDQFLNGLAYEEGGETSRVAGHNGIG